MLWKKYSSALILTPDSLTLREGLFSVKRTEVALEYVQSIEIKQSLTERFLFVGTILAGSAATPGYEIKFRGAPSPRWIAEKIRRYSRMQEGKEIQGWKKKI